MGNYTDKIKYSALLLIFILASCSSAPLKSSDPSPSPATSALPTFSRTKTQSLEAPSLIPELCSLAVSEKPSIPETRATQERNSVNKAHPDLPELKFPVPSGSLSSAFGYRRGIFHTGLDIRAPQGEDVLACADGRVACAGTRKGYRSYGRTVLIDHGRNVFTLYAHLSNIHVTAGQKVQRGQKIACVGCTGRATAPHLHLEVRVGDRAFDPYACFSHSELRRIEVAKGFGGSPLGPGRVRRLSARR
jgi:murein DD-endopeptidase MepM/ murein hydrolase activator NlpD